MSKDSSDNKLAVKDKSWNPWVGILVGLLALFGSQIIVGALAYLVLSLVKGYSVQHTSNLLENSISAQFVTLVLAEIVAVTIVILYIRGYKDSFKTIGLRKPKWLDPIFGLIAFPAYLIIYIVLLTILTHVFHGINVNEKQQLGFNDPKGALKLIMTFISLVIAPPIAEEIIFRGLIYSSLKKTLPIWAAVIITGLLFAAGHLSEGGSSGLLYVAAIDTFSLSLVLVFLREKTGGLWSSMTLHALKNTVAFLALFALHLG